MTINIHDINRENYLNFFKSPSIDLSRYRGHKSYQGCDKTKGEKKQNDTHVKVAAYISTVMAFMREKFREMFRNARHWKGCEPIKKGTRNVPREARLAKMQFMDNKVKSGSIDSCRETFSKPRNHPNSFPLTVQ